MHPLVDKIPLGIITPTKGFAANNMRSPDIHPYSEVSFGRDERRTTVARFSSVCSISLSFNKRNGLDFWSPPQRL